MRRELHCWVYDNVRAKWPAVLRRPSRLPGLFSGYHAPSGLVAAVLSALGVRLEDLTAEAAAAGVSGEKEGGFSTLVLLPDLKLCVCVCAPFGDGLCFPGVLGWR